MRNYIIIFVSGLLFSSCNSDRMNNTNFVFNNVSINSLRTESYNYYINKDLGVQILSRKNDKDEVIYMFDCGGQVMQKEIRFGLSGDLFKSAESLLQNHSIIMLDSISASKAFRVLGSQSDTFKCLIYQQKLNAVCYKQPKSKLVPCE